MRTVYRAILPVSTFLAVGGGAWAQTAVGATFVAPLSANQEVPAVETNARGQAVLHVSADGSQLDFQLIVSELTGVTQSHIHCGPRGANGPVPVFLFGFVPDGVDVNGILSGGGVTDADSIARPDSAACPGGVASLADLIGHMRRGNAYVNVHTLANPGGEVRGQALEAGPRMPRRR